MCDRAVGKPGRKGGDDDTAAPALVTSTANAASAPKELFRRIYVGLDIGYREHVAAASPLSAFNVRRNSDAWKRVKPIHFASDAAGFGRFQRYLDRCSPDPRDFLILLEPTGSYGLTVLLYLLGKGYRALQVDNRAVKDYREKIFGSETKTDDTDARLMARMGFLHELVGEEFSIRPVLLMNPDAAALRGMVHDLAKLQKEITRRRNQLQQMAALTFPELKAFFSKDRRLPQPPARSSNTSLLRRISRQLLPSTSPKCSAQRMPTAMPLGQPNFRLWREPLLASQR